MCTNTLKFQLVGGRGLDKSWDNNLDVLMHPVATLMQQDNIFKHEIFCYFLYKFLCKISNSSTISPFSWQLDLQHPLSDTFVNWGQFSLGTLGDSSPILSVRGTCPDHLNLASLTFLFPRDFICTKCSHDDRCGLPCSMLFSLRLYESGCTFIQMDQEPCLTTKEIMEPQCTKSTKRVLNWPHISPPQHARH